MIIKTEPDIQKAKALIEMAKITLERLKELDIEKYPTNTLSDYYDILHKLMEALNYIDGFKTKGEGAHKELIDRVCKNNGLDESIRQFLQEMREYRNRISYEGFMIKPGYITQNNKKIKGFSR